MRKFLMPPLIGATAFVFSFLAVFIWSDYVVLRLSVPIVSYEEAISKGTTTVEFCELKNFPHKYNGQVVRIDTNLYWTMHGYFLADKNCIEGNERSRIAISFYEPNVDTTFNMLEPLTERRESNEPTKLTAIGRFIYKEGHDGSDSMIDRTPLQFEIYKIESVSKK